MLHGVKNSCYSLPVFLVSNVFVAVFQSRWCPTTSYVILQLYILTIEPLLSSALTHSGLGSEDLLFVVSD